MENKPDALASSAGDSAERARSAGEDAIGNVKSAAKDAAGAVKEKAKETVEEAQQRVAEQARTAATALRDTASRLEGDLPWLDAGLRKAADGIENLTSGLHSGNFEQTINGVGDFARRQPALFLGLSVALGFGLARVGKTAVEEVQDKSITGASPGSDYRDAVAPYAPVSEA